MSTYIEGDIPKVMPVIKKEDGSPISRKELILADLKAAQSQGIEYDPTGMVGILKALYEKENPPADPDEHLDYDGHSWRSYVPQDIIDKDSNALDCLGKLHSKSILTLEEQQCIVQAWVDRTLTLLVNKSEKNLELVRDIYNNFNDVYKWAIYKANHEDKIYDAIYYIPNHGALVFECFDLIYYNVAGKPFKLLCQGLGTDFADDTMDDPEDDSWINRRLPIW